MNACNRIGTGRCQSRATVRPRRLLRAAGFAAAWPADSPGFVWRLHCLTALGAVLALAVGTGCAPSRPRILEVSTETRIRNISPANENLFVPDRASRFRLEVSDLPPAEQRQQFYVRWTPATVPAVKFQYRQVNAPNRLGEITVAAAGRTATVFEIAGAEFLEGGPVSAWRVSLWDGERLLAEKRSALW
jgi:hypothetical protein